VKDEIPEQHIAAQGCPDPHVNRMRFIENIEKQEGILVKDVGISPGFDQSVFDKTYPFILEVYTGKTLLSPTPDDLLFADINGFYEIIALQQGSKQENPDNQQSDAESVSGKNQWGQPLQ
jgi:hypothetical protein